MAQTSHHTHNGCRIVLASSSPYRKEQLEQLGLNPECIAPNVDESEIPDETPRDMAIRLSEKKAQSVASKLNGNAIIIAGDQTACLEGQRLRKPGNFNNACDQLRGCSGRTLSFHSGLCVHDRHSGKQQTLCVETRVSFRTLSDRQIEAYIKKEQPYNCVGAFKCESLGIGLFDKIESEDPSALMGVPLISLSKALFEFGLDILSDHITI
ncbi:MAG: Maf family nucleotide pyrophosphatase [Agarilytica sp.]